MLSSRTSESLYSKSNSKEQEKILLQPYIHFRQLDELSKKYLPKALKSFNYWLKIPDDKFNIIENITTMTHYAILLFDTIKDEYICDKGVPTVHSIYGVPSIINTASYVHFVALEKSFELQNSKVIDIFSERTIEIYKSIHQEYEWSDSLYCPSEEEYKKMCVQKGGSGFKGALEAMQVFSENKTDYTEICNTLAIFMVLYVDFIQMRSKKGSFCRVYGDRISSRRYSFPIIHAFKTQPENMSLFKIFQRKSNVAELKDYFISTLDAIGSFEYTKNTLISLKKEAYEEIKRLGGNPYLSNLIEEMLHDVTSI